MARRRVSEGRQFDVSTVTIESASSGHTPVELSLDLWSEGTDPARIVMFRVDMGEWLDSLRGDFCKIAKMLAEGNNVTSIARKLKRPNSYVAKLRRDLRYWWRLYWPDEEASYDMLEDGSSSVLITQHARHRYAERLKRNPEYRRILREIDASTPVSLAELRDLRIRRRRDVKYIGNREAVFALKPDLYGMRLLTVMQRKL